MPHRAVLLVIVLAAAAVRFAGSDWGASYYLHPDERFMTMVVTGIHWPPTVAAYFDSATSPLNPFNAGYGSYVYGTLPLFLAKALGVLTNDIVYGDAHLPGRWLSALADTGTVALTYWIARRLFTPAAGLIAAALLAFAPLNIQSAHYFTTDSVAAFFAMAAFAASLQAWRTRGWRWFVVAGACVGMAAASKPNLALTAGFLLLPLLEAIRVRGIEAVAPSWPLRRSRGRRRSRLVPGTALAGVAALATFRVFQPYAFRGSAPWDLRLDPRWTATLDYWRQVQGGYIDLPPGVQWAGRAPMTFILDNLVRWGMGPALGLTALAGLAAAGFGMLAGRRWPSWWVLAIVLWAAFHLVFFGTAFVKAQRYLLPAYPFLAILAAALLDGLPDRLRRLPSRLRLSGDAVARIRAGAIALVVVATVFWGLAVTSIYLHPQTRVAASEWIYDNVPAGGTIATEHWDDGLPLALPGRPIDSYTGVQLPWYDADTDAKLSRVIGILQRSDYIVLSSDRLLGSIPRMPDRYPMTTAYYDALLSGELGFELVATFDSPPSLFGIEIDDRDVEEALTVYDHPYVSIFRKTDAWSAHDAWYLLDAALGDGGVQRRPIDPPEASMMLSDAERAERAASGTWSAMFGGDGPSGVGAAVLWYLVVQLLALPAMPLAWRLLPSLPDRGYAVAKTVGVVGIGWLAWLLASLRLVAFGRIGALVAVVIAVVLGGAAVGFRLRPILSDLRRRWRWLVATEAIFLVAFAAMTWMRALNPDLWLPGRGGEKPMELTIFNAILRSEWMPPQDPWLAGGALHYYYVGYVPWALVSRLTGIVPEVAYNLALPSLFALLAVNAWVSAGALIVRMRGRGGEGWRPILLALPAPVAVAVLGNLDLVRRIAAGQWGAAPAPGWLDALGAAGDVGWGIWTVLTRPVDLPPSAYWDPTRVIPGTINEFPYFSFLFGDLHAHVLAMPVVMAVVVVAVALATAPGDAGREGVLATLGGWREAVSAGLLAGLLTGFLLASNTWDYPPALALVVGAAAIRAVSCGGPIAPWRAARDVAVFAALVIAAGRLAFWPFLSRFGSIQPQVLPGLETTRLSDYLVIHGLVLVVIGAYLAASCAHALDRARRDRWVAIVAGIGAVAGVALLVGAALTGNTAIFLAGMLVVVAVAVIDRPREPAHLTVCAMTALALGLGLVPELWRLGNDIGRMNLVFKLYLHAWLLLAVAATVAGVALVSGMRRSMRSSRRAPALAGFVAARAWLVGVALLLIGALAYPALATGLRLDDRFNPLDPTLDGFAYLGPAELPEGPDGGAPVTFPLESDRRAVAWLRANVAGSPVILEAQLPAYRWGGRISSMTGLPTVLGWTWHEIQQRPGWQAEVDRRVADVARIYDSPGDYASVEPLLERYDVELIVVGGLERALYDPIGLAKFDAAVETGDLKVAYNGGGVTIYVIAP